MCTCSLQVFGGLMLPSNCRSGFMKKMFIFKTLHMNFAYRNSVPQLYVLPHPNKNTVGPPQFTCTIASYCRRPERGLSTFWGGDACCTVLKFKGFGTA